MFDKSENSEGDSPFAEILMELAKEDIGEDASTAGPYFLFSGIYAPNFRNEEPNCFVTRSPGDFKRPSYSSVSCDGFNSGFTAQIKPVDLLRTIKKEENYVTSDVDHRIGIATISSGYKRRKIISADNMKKPRNESIEFQARSYLSDAALQLSKRIKSSQMQLQVLQSQCDVCDLLAFIARAMQLFADNNRMNLSNRMPSSPTLFHREQKEFVDQAVSIYLRQFMPCSPLIVLSENAVCSRDEMNRDGKIPSPYSIPHSLSCSPVWIV